MNPYIALKADFDHLQDRALKLFKAGKQREFQLEEAVANAKKYFGKILELDDLDKIKEIAEPLRKEMSEALGSKYS